MWPVGGCCYDVCVARQSVVVVMTCVWPVSRWLLLRRVCGPSVGGCCYDVCVARQSVIVVTTCVWPVSRWLLL